jgi:hypothetical protein
MLVVRDIETSMEQSDRGDDLFVNHIFIERNKCPWLAKYTILHRNISP